MNIAILLGAGASIPAGCPSTKSITKSVLGKQTLSTHSDGSYYPMPPLCGLKDGNVPGILHCLKGLYAELISRPTATQREITYEDIYSILSQVELAWELRVFDPPAIQFARQFWSEVQKSIPIRVEAGIEIGWRLDHAIRECRKYVHDMAWHSLKFNPDNSDHLKWIGAIMNDPQVSRLSAFTLNHDISLESYLNSSGFEFIDGFGPRLGDVRPWNPDVFKSNESKCVLLKIHGSTDWFEWSPIAKFTGGRGVLQFCGGKSLTEAKDDQGREIEFTEHRPVMLLGGTNKFIAYSSGIYATLMHYLREYLEKTQYLIVVGYSFGDKAVNDRIQEWFLGDSERKLIVCHQRPDNLIQNAHPEMDGFLQRPSERQHFIEKRIQDLHWDNLKSQMSDIKPG